MRGMELYIILLIVAVIIGIIRWRITGSFISKGGFGGFGKKKNDDSKWE